MCCAGALTEDLKCCEDGFDRCGVCGGDNTGCSYKGRFSFRTKSLLTRAAVSKLCTNLKAVLNTIPGVESVSITCQAYATAYAEEGRRKLAQTGETSTVTLTTTLPMSAATPAALANMAILKPSAHPS